LWAGPPGRTINAMLLALRRRISAPRTIALVIAGLAGIWRALGGLYVGWTPGVPGRAAVAIQDELCVLQHQLNGGPASCPSTLYPAVPATSGHLVFEAWPWLPQYLAEGLVLAVAVFIAIAALRIAWSSFGPSRQ
jgi:hypothetical protein